MKLFLKISRYIMLIGLPCIVIACLWMKRSYPQSFSIDWVYLGAFGGLIGIGVTIITMRTLFMRMLFHPRESTRFGIQGILPKNMPIIAEKIGEETEKKFLNVDAVMLHIEQQDVLDKTVDIVMEALKDFLSKKENRDQIVTVTLQFYHEHRDKILVQLPQTATGWLGEQLKNKDAFASIWEALKPRVKEFFESEALKQKASAWIVHDVVEKSPELFLSICNQIFGGLVEKQALWKKTILLAIGLTDLDKNIQNNLIHHILNSPETAAQVTRFIDKNIINIEALLEQDMVYEKLGEFSQWLNSTALDSNSITLVEAKIESFLRDNSSWDMIDRYLLSLINTVQTCLKEFLRQPESIEVIRALVEYSLQGLNVRQFVEEKIKSQDINILEQSLRSLSREYMPALEVCGGVLGMFAGLAAPTIQLLIKI